jgi:triphosphoribosyl-dephospho-CoA synthase
LKQNYLTGLPAQKIQPAPPHWTPDIVAAAAQLACLLEASAEKPGNVTPRQAFANMAYEDFLRSAAALGPAMARAGARGVGETVLEAITATRYWTKTNTNLGIALLFAPLAKAAQAGEGPDLRVNLKIVLRTLTVADACAAYEAIRLAAPGGLGEAPQHDVRDVPTVTLRSAMAHAAARDSIAAEYGSDYAIVFERGLPAFRAAQAGGADTGPAVVQTYLTLLAAVPDTLIARKRGLTVAWSVTAKAAEALAAGGMFGPAGRRAVTALDQWLRRAGDNSLNPGTTADMTAAVLFVAMLEEKRLEIGD